MDGVRTNGQASGNRNDFGCLLGSTLPPPAGAGTNTQSAQRLHAPHPLGLTLEAPFGPAVGFITGAVMFRCLTGASATFSPVPTCKLQGDGSPATCQGSPVTSWPGTGSERPAVRGESVNGG